MNILFISRCLPAPLHYGDRLMLYYLARELGSRGHRLDLLAFDPELEVDSGVESFENFAFVQSVREHSRSGFDYLLRLLKPFPNRADRSWHPPMWRAIEERIEAVPFDVLHFFGGIQVYEFRNLVYSRFPTLIVPYDSMTLLLERALDHAGQPLRWLSVWSQLAVARYYERRMYAGFGRVVTVAAADEARLRRLTPELQTAVIPNGVDCSPSALDERGEKTKTLVFVGNYAYPPNLDAGLILVKEILPRVQRKEPGARLLLLGANPPELLRKFAGADVEVTGLVPDVRVYLRRSTCFVSPLRSGAGIHNKILEAMAEGVPVVATPLSCEGIEVTPGENVLLGDSPAELAAGVLRLLGDGELRRRVGEGGLRLMSELYAWASVADRYEQLYSTVIAEFRGKVSEHG